MLEFKEIFPQGHTMNTRDIPLIMKCKNVDFGHVDWCNNLPNGIYNNKVLMMHLIDNIIDISVMDGAYISNFTLFDKIMCYSHGSVIRNYVLNHSYINYRAFRRESSMGYDTDYNHTFCKYRPFVNYLTNVSFGKFKGYYNIEKYYYIVHMMLLIMKAQQKMPYVGSTVTSLPPVVIKHLIIPFVYQ